MLISIPYLKKDMGYFARYIHEYILKKSLANHNKTSENHAKIIVEKNKKSQKNLY